MGADIARLTDSRNALDYLERHAPRAWCKRLLSSLIFDQRLVAYFAEGDIGGYVPIDVLVDEPAPNEEGWREAVIEKYGRLAGPRLDRLKDNYLAQITGYRWSRGDPYKDGAPTEIPYGYFYYADTLDWDEGILAINNFYPNEADLFLFFDDLYLRDFEKDEILFSWIRYDITFKGLSFETDAIELLASGAPLDTQRMGHTSVNARQRGRPEKHDWTGALAHIIAKANTPDGLPTGPGAQAAIERLIQDYFISKTGDSPALSQIRTQAQRIIAAVEER